MNLNQVSAVQITTHTIRAPIPTIANYARIINPLFSNRSNHQRKKIANMSTEIIPKNMGLL
jgi:hypothetical protein